MLVKAVTVPVTEYVEPGGTGIFAWLFGVTLILKAVRVVVTGIPQLVRDTVLEAGSAWEQYVVVPALFVIATEDRPPETPEAKVTVAAVTVSVPDEVWSVKASKSVADAPGAIEELEGSVPSPRVVTAAAVGVNGLPVGTTPVAE